MRPLSATDAIQPAWNHARRMTLEPRNWRLALKITAVAFFARAGGCNSSFSSPGGHGSTHSLPISAAIGSTLVVLGIVATAVAVVFFYVSSRLQFVLFESVLRSDTTIAPIWQRYGRSTWYWIWLKLAFVLAVIVCLSPLLVPVLIAFIHALPAGGVVANPGAFLVSIASFVGAIFFAVLIIGAGYTLLADFGLPAIALEGTPLVETLRRVWTLLRVETGQVLLYLLMRFVMGLAASIAACVALVIGMLVALIPLGGIGLVVWLSMRHAGPVTYILMMAILAVLGLIFALLVMLAIVLLFGYAQLFFAAYALYFLGGRYPLVGAYLEPYLPQPLPIPPPLGGLPLL